MTAPKNKIRCIESNGIDIVEKVLSDVCTLYSGNINKICVSCVCVCVWCSGFWCVFHRLEMCMFVVLIVWQMVVFITGVGYRIKAFQTGQIKP